MKTLIKMTDTVKFYSYAAAVARLSKHLYLYKIQSEVKHTYVILPGTINSMSVGSGAPVCPPDPMVNVV